VQDSPSSQLSGVPATHPLIASQISAPLQTKPSLHSESFGTCLQLLVASSHTSVVHATLSLQSGGVPGTQPAVLSQRSAPSQKLPSSQAVSNGTCWQTWLMSQKSVVQAIPSLQSASEAQSPPDVVDEDVSEEVVDVPEPPVPLTVLVRSADPAPLVLVAGGWEHATSAAIAIPHIAQPVCLARMFPPKNR
jgi:hypothetical protein